MTEPTTTPETASALPEGVPNFPTMPLMHAPKRRDMFVAVRSLEAVTAEMVNIHARDPLNMSNSAVGIVLAPANPSLQPKNESFATISARLPRDLTKDVNSVDLSLYFAPEVRERLLLDAHGVKASVGRKYIHVATYFLRGVDSYNVRDVTHPELDQSLSQGIICVGHNQYIDVKLNDKAQVYDVESSLNMSEFVDTTWSNTFIRPGMSERFAEEGLNRLDLLEGTKMLDEFFFSDETKAAVIAETVKANRVTSGE